MLAFSVSLPVSVSAILLHRAALGFLLILCLSLLSEGSVKKATVKKATIKKATVKKEIAKQYRDSNECTETGTIAYGRQRVGFGDEGEGFRETAYLCLLLHHQIVELCKVVIKLL